MLLLHGPEDLSFDPGPDPDIEHIHNTLPAQDPQVHTLASSSAPGSRAPGAAPAPAAEDRCSLASSAGRPGEPAAGTAAQRRHPGQARPRGCRDALLFLLWFTAWSTVIVVLADASLRQHSEHFCGGWLQRARAITGAKCPRAELAGVLAPEDNFWSAAAAQHWAVETYGFTLQAQNPFTCLCTVLYPGACTTGKCGSAHGLKTVRNSLGMYLVMRPVGAPCQSHIAF